MKALLDAIDTKRNGSALDTSVGGRIYLDEAPEGAEFPYVVAQIISNVPEYPGGKTIEGALIQFSIFSASKDYTEITGILTNLRSLYDDCSLTITGETLIYFIRGNLTTMVEEVTNAGTVGVKHYAQEYELSTVK